MAENLSKPAKMLKNVICQTPNIIECDIFGFFNLVYGVRQDVIRLILRTYSAEM